MQIVTLDQVKGQLNITFSSRDAAITDIINRTENELLQYIGVADLDALYAAVGETSVLVSSALESAVIIGCHMRNQDPGADIWKGGVITRLLFPYRVPAIAAASD